MKKNKILFLATLIVSISIFTGCKNVSSIFGGSGERPNTSITNSDKTPYVPDDLQFNVVTAQKLSEIKALKEQADYEEYVNLKSVLKRIKNSVVKVSAVSDTQEIIASGVVVAVSAGEDEESSSLQNSTNIEAEAISKSYIVTCHHLIEGASKVQVEDAEGNVYDAEFIGSDPDSDVCVFGVTAKLSAVEFYNDTDTLEAGESVVAIGNPFSLAGGTVTSGILCAEPSEIEIDNEMYNLLQTDAFINDAFSGGGLFTSTGFFIGMIDAKYKENFSDLSGLGFAISANEIMEIATELSETKTATSPGYIKGKYKLGASFIDEYANRWGTQINVKVDQLSQEGSFYESNLKDGDIIKTVTYKGETYVVTRSEDLLEHLNSIQFEIGDVLTFAITRDETSITVPVTIRQYIYGA